MRPSHGCRALTVALAVLACRSAPRGDSAGTSPFGTSLEHSRWTVIGFPMSYHVWGDSVEILMYPPQAPPPSLTWRRQGSSIQIAGDPRMQAESTPVSQDTIELSWQTGPRRRWSRVSGSPVGADIAGTWVSRAQDMITTLTFRSDGLVVMEVGVMPLSSPRLRGNQMAMTNGPETIRYTLRRVGDTVIARPVAQDRRGGRVREIKMVRRPWGCFGVAKLDGSARECR